MGSSERPWRTDCHVASERHLIGRHGFTCTPTIKTNLEHENSPLKIFHEILTNETSQFIAGATDDNAENGTRSITRDKIKVLLALLILKGIVKKLTLPSYWNRKSAKEKKYVGKTFHLIFTS